MEENKNSGRTNAITPHGGYRGLKSFQNAIIIHDATVTFCGRFLDPRSRTNDQMVQAARSGKQNIAEGSMASGTSRKMELRLVGVARASLEELLLDYEDFLRQKKLGLWNKDDPEALAIRRMAYDEHRSYTTYMSYAETSPPGFVANALICLIHQTNYLLDQLLRQLERRFIEEGGFSERLHAIRMARRNSKD
jgi:restriction system protein